MKPRWIAVAHRAGARLIEKDLETGELRVVEEHDNPNGRKKSSEIDTDAPGQAFSGHGRSGGHPMPTSENAHERAASDFARLLGSVLNARRADGHFDELTLVAEPHFLGLLRAALDRPTAACVTRSVHKDLAHVELRDLGRFLKPENGG